MTKPTLNFTRPVPSDLSQAEFLVIRFCKWSPEHRAIKLETSGFGKFYRADPAELQAHQALLLDQALRYRLATGEMPSPDTYDMQDGKDARTYAYSEPLTTAEALAISRCWQALPVEPVDLGSILLEHYMLPNSNLFAASRQLGIEPSEWCSLRDQALRMLAISLKTYHARPESSWGDRAAAARGFVSERMYRAGVRARAVS